MILKHIEISNFRCLKEYSIDFFEGINILIGRNGSGKSTLLHAIQKGLSFMFSNDRSVSEVFLSAGVNNLNIRSFDVLDFNYDSEKRENALYASIDAKGSFDGESIEWSLYKRNAPNASLYPSKYKDAFNTVMTRIRQGAPYPILAYYSDSYPHINVNLTQQASDIIKQDRIPRNFGYYQWDEESSCAAIWEKRLSERYAKLLPLYTIMSRAASEENYLMEQPENEENILKLETVRKSIQEYNALFEPLYRETDYIEKKLKKFISFMPNIEGEDYNISYLSVSDSGSGYVLTINFVNGKSSTLTDLPAGYRRLLSIVLDLAYRSFILNDDVVSSGIVIIDEIDLHLHPSLEGCVIDAFRKCFPKVQFLVSTHSVAVISNLPTAEEAPDNRIFVLRDDINKPEMLRNLNGIDYDIVLRDFMDTYSRNNDVKSLIDKYLLFYSNGLNQEADTVYAKIKELVGESGPVIDELKEKINNYK